MKTKTKTNIRCSCFWAWSGGQFTQYSLRKCLDGRASNFFCQNQSPESVREKRTVCERVISRYLFALFVVQRHETETRGRYIMIVIGIGRRHRRSANLPILREKWSWSTWCQWIAASNVPLCRCRFIDWSTHTTHTNEINWCNFRILSGLFEYVHALHWSGEREKENRKVDDVCLSLCLFSIISFPVSTSKGCTKCNKICNFRMRCTLEHKVLIRHKPNRVEWPLEKGWDSFEVAVDNGSAAIVVGQREEREMQKKIISKMAHNL